MVNVQTRVDIVDNSGGIIGGCIQVLKISSRIGAVPGQTITISIKKNIFKKHIVKKSKIIVKGQICKALIVRTLKGLKRWGNFFLRASSNSVVILNQYDLPYATRLFGPVFRELKWNIKYNKVLSIAQIII